MKRLYVFVCTFLLCLASVAWGQSQACTAGATQIVTNLAATTYTDTTVADGQVYGYTVVAVDPFGFSTCSNIVSGVTIPATGTHSVALAWTASTTSGVTYAVFRAQTPAPPTNATATVN